VSQTDWIKVTPVRDTVALATQRSSAGLGAGETAAIQLAKELGVELLLMDERKGRRLALATGLKVVGCVGILEELYRRGSVTDLHAAYAELVRQNVRIDIRTLEDSLRQFNLPPL